MEISIKVVASEKEQLCLADVKKAINCLPETGKDGIWKVKNPQQVAVGLENVLTILNDKLALQSSADKLCKGVVDVKYNDDDQMMQDNLNKLFDEWESKLPDSCKKLFNRDGFYPGYNSQRIKILFVGREACWMARKDYIATMYANFQNKSIEGWSVNQYPFQRRQAYIAYGLLNNWPDWDKVPYASDVCQRVGNGGISWAFINMSKLSNETGDWRTDCNRYWPFIRDERNRLMLQDQIEILKPDVIIGANVPELADILGYGEPDQAVDACYYYKKKDCPHFLNCFHFAAIKKDKECFYEAVKEVCERNKICIDGCCSDSELGVKF